MQNSAAIEHAESLVQEEKWYELRQLISGWPEPEIADLLFELPAAKRAILFRLLPHDTASDVFSFLEVELQNRLLEDLTEEETRRLVTSLAPDDRIHLLEDLPGEAVQKLLNLLPPADLWKTRQLLGYPEESVGRLMTPDYVAVRRHWSVAEALSHIRMKGQKAETISTIYVVENRWQFVDAVPLESIVLAQPEARMEELLTREGVTLSPLADREEAVRMITRYDVFSIPVVDARNVLLGVVTADDVFDVAEEEATEDFQKSVAVNPLKSTYREASLWELFGKRFPWLLALIGVNLLSSTVIANYSELLEAAIALTFFMPLLLGTGGNTGSQAATLVVRALSTDDLDLSDWFRVTGKEVLVGCALAVAMGLCTSLLGFWRGDWHLALAVALSMAAIVLWANLMGAVLPFVLMRFKVDPAVASSPLITSVSDVTGLIIYFLIARAILAV
ncbi:MAG: magnesium transporter [Bryobacterales bacterium]|nr:magnesium transporter [Bryobacterales bacterium]